VGKIINDNLEVCCPICLNKGRIGSLVKNDFTRTQLEKYFGDKIHSKDLGLYDFNMCYCINCDFEWSHPMKPGSHGFYSWITRKPQYYCKERWEWNIVISDLIKKQYKSVLDVGCGDGKFLVKCENNINNIKCLGLDTSKYSVDSCMNQGINAVLSDVKEYSKIDKKKYDAVTAFHCLEHVENPVDFISDLINLVNKDGSLYISTPYAPHPSELWYEVLSYPPHHLTRWRKKSYESIAKKLNLKLSFYMPYACSLYQRVVNSLSLYWYGVNERKPLLSWSSFKKMLDDPISFVRIIFRHIVREKVYAIRNISNGIQKENKLTADYLILAKFFK